MKRLKRACSSISSRMLMKKLLCLIMVVLLTACSSVQVLHGKVVSKQYKPQVIVLMPIVLSCGKNCFSTIIVPIIFPESWSVTVEGPDKEGQVVQTELYVSQQQYDLIREGDEYVCGASSQPECVTERPNRRAE